MKKVLCIIIVGTLLLSALAACAQPAAPTASPSTPASAAVATQAPATQAPATSAPAKKVTVAVSIRSLDSEYHMQYVAGAQLFVDTLPPGSAEVKVLPCDANDDKQINDLKAQIASSGENTVLFIDPNNAPNVSAVADICEEAHVYWCDAWNLPEGISPMNYKYFTCFQSCDGEKQGYDIAVDLFKHLKTPGQGKILAMQGMLANNAAVDRWAGLQKALKEYPRNKAS